jgi:hypothetical protein
MGKQKNGKKKSSSSKNASGQGGGELLYISPSRIRYQHSRIRATFSGCGRSVTDTLDEIRRGELNPWDLPVIQVNVFYLYSCLIFDALLVSRESKL